MKGTRMSFDVTRRMILGGGVAALAGARGAAAKTAPGPEKAASGPDPSSQIAAIERRAGGRLGVFAIDTANGRRLQHFRHERFPMCSTFKFLLVAAVLQRVDRGAERLERPLAYGESDLLEYAPVAKEHLRQGGMTIVDCCAAAVQWSDNTAANLLLKLIGGPTALTAFIQTLGDEVTRLDNIEPTLNVVASGEIHDTTTPEAMVGLLGTVLLGRVLSPASHAKLEGWMLDLKVGSRRLPAGLPSEWQIAHKTGTSSIQTNDIGVLWPPNRAPILVAAFYSRGDLPQEKREDVLRDVGRIVATAFSDA
jgi:beta-lactamase class A